MPGWSKLALTLGCFAVTGGLFFSSLREDARQASQGFFSALADALHQSSATAAEAQAPSVSPDAFVSRFGSGGDVTLRPLTGPDPIVPLPQFSPAPPADPGPAELADADRAIVLSLVRTTLIALHQANITGNYTVFRELGSPSFQENNSDARLAETFAAVRKSGVGLDAVALTDPHIVHAALSSDKMLQIASTLATKPVPVQFQLVFQQVDASWRLYTISLGPDRSAMTVSEITAPAVEKPGSPTRQGSPKLSQ